MKKLFVLICAVLMALCLAGCTEESGTNANMENPVVEVTSLDEINNTLGCNLFKPEVMGITNEVFSMIGDTVGQYQFEANGTPFTIRFSGTFDDDISGYYIDSKTAFADTLDNYGMQYVTDGKAKLARFINVDGQYVIIAEDAGAYTEEQFLEIAEAYRSEIALSHETVDSLVGNYIDSTSGRAILEVNRNDDGTYTLVVSWGSSATTMDRWRMTCEFKESKFTYTDGVKEEVTYDEEGVATETTTEENLAGEFEFKDSAIYWTDAGGVEALEQCVFVKGEAE